jgi:hypothetical protein
MRVIGQPLLNACRCSRCCMPLLPLQPLQPLLLLHASSCWRLAYKKGSGALTRTSDTIQGGGL